MRRDFHVGFLALAGFLVGIGGVGLYSVPAQAQVAGEEPTLQVGPERDKALRYHKALQRRPAPGFLFDRFCDAWLEDGTYAELETFLDEQATASGELHDRLLLAYLYARQGDDVKSLEQFRSALAADPGSASAWYEKAVTEARTLDLETALADLDRADAAEPDDEQAILIGKLRASLLVRNRQNDEAVAAWNTLIASHPDDEGLLEDIIEQMMGEGLYDEALEKSDALIAVTRDPYQQVVRRMRKGDILQRAGRQSVALEVYSQTLLKIGRDTWLEREMIAQIDMLFRREDNLTGLKEQLDKLLAAEPDRIALHRAAARLQQQLGDSDAAVEAFKRIVELTPGDRSNREAFVALLAESGRLEQAIAQLQGLAEQYPDDAELAMRLAGLHYLAEDPELAVAAVNEFLEKSARSEQAFLRAARVLQGYELPAEARRMYEAGVAAFPDSITCREAFAGWLHEHDEKPKALEIWRSVASGGDRSEQVRVARILASHNEHQAAYDLLAARRDEFADDSVYLGQFIDEAIALDKFNEAAPLVLQRVRLSDDAIDLDTSILQAMRVYSQLDDRQAMLGEVRQAAESSIPAACLLAEILESRGERSEADALLESRTASIAKDDSPDEARLVERQMVLNQQIRLASARQDWPQAAVAAKAMIELPRGRNSVNVRRLVDLYLRNQQLDEALHWVGEWKQVSPGSLLPWINESKILARVGREDDSLRVLRAAARKFPEDADLAAMLAEKFALNGLPKEAERIYWKQFESSEQLADRLRWVEQLARLSDMNGTTEQLIETMKERCESNPESIEPLLALAQVHRVADNFEERRQALMEATRKQPDNLNLMLEIARMEEAEGEWEQALATLESAQSLDRGDQVKQQIARICMGYGDLDRGLRILAELAGGENANPRDVEAIADALVRADQWERARDYLAPHVTRLPEDYRLKYLMATIDEFLGDEDSAWRSFVELLSADAVLPNLTASQAPVPMMFELDSIRQSLPPGVATFYESNMLESEAYSYRESRSFYPSAYGHLQGANEVIRLPADSEGCRKLALCHLLAIAAEAPEEGQEAMVGILAAQGVEDASLMVAMTETGDAIFQIPAALNDEFPDSPTLLSISVMNSMSRPADEELLLKAHAQFKDTYPDVAFVAAIQLAMRNPEHRGLAHAAIEYVRAQENPSEIVIGALFQMMMGDSYDSPGDEALEISGLINDLLIEIYPKLRTSQTMMVGMGGYVFQAVVSAMARDPDPTRLIRFLESELEEFNASGKSINQSRAFGLGYSGWSGRASLFELPAFPPTDLAGLPDTFSGVGSILSGEGSDELLGMSLSGGGLVEESDTDYSAALRFRDAVNAVSDPLLKAFLQSHIGMAREVENALAGKEEESDAFADLRETLKAFSERGKPDLDMMLIEAGLAAHCKQWNEASRILEQSRTLPMTQERRTAIDSALVAIAISDDVAGSDFSGQEQIEQSARSAALRLRRGNLDSEQRQQLLSVLERLGLTDEAEQMEQRMAASPTPYSGSYSTAPLMSSGSSSPERILELIDDGREDVATRLLEQQFNALTREILNDLNGYDRNRYELREFVEMVEELAMQEALLASLDPGEEGPARKLASFALGHDIFGDKAKAVELYRQVIASDPKQMVCRGRLIAAEFVQNPEVIGQQLESVSGRDASTLAALTVNLIREAECTAEQYLAGVEQLVLFAEQLPDDTKQDADWIGVVIRTVASLGTLDNVGSDPYSRSRPRQTPNLLSLYTRPSNEDARSVESADDDGDDAVQDEVTQARIHTVNAQRRELHERACEVALKSPAIAKMAFTAWLAARVAAGEEPDDEAVEKARQSVMVSDPTRKLQNSGNAMPIRYYNRYQGHDGTTGNEVALVSPELFLARHYAQQSPPDEAAVSQLVAVLNSNRNRDIADSLDNQFRLYAAADDAYIEACRQYLEWGSVRRNRDAFVPRLMVDVWAERELSCDLEPIILDLIDTVDPRRGDGSEQFQAIARYCARVAANPSDADIRQLIGQVRTKVVGSDEDLNTLVERAQRSGYNDRLESYIEFLGTLAQEIETVIPALEEGERIAFDHYTIESNAQDTIRQFLDSEPNAEKVLSWLQEARFVGPVDQFRPMLGELSVKDLSYGVGSEDGWPSATALNELLEKRPRPAFGDRMVQMIIAREIDSVSLLGALAAELPAVEKLSPERQVALYEISMPTSRYGRSVNIDELEGDVKKVAEILRAAKLSKAGDVLAKVLEARSLDELEVESYNVDEWILSDLLPFARAEPKRAANAMVHLLELAEDFQSPSSRSYYVAGRPLTAREQLLHEIMGSSPGLADLALIIDLVQHPRFGFVAPGENVLGLRGVFASEFSGVLEVTGTESAGLAVEKFDAFIEKLATLLDGRDPVSLMKVMASISKTLSDDDRQQIQAAVLAASELEGAAPLYRAWGYALGLNFSQGALIDDDEGQADTLDVVRLEQPSPLQQQMLSIVTDEDRTLSERFAVAQAMIAGDGQLPLQAMQTCLATVAQAMGEEGFAIELAIDLIPSLLDIENDEAFLECVGEFGSKLERRLFHPASQIELDKRSFRSTVQFFHRIGKEAAITQLARDGRDSAFGRESVAVLLRLGYISQARQMVGEAFKEDPALTETFEVDTNALTRDDCYDERLASGVTALIELLPTAGEKYLAELWFASMPDSPLEFSANDETAADDIANAVPRSALTERIQSLARRFGETEFKTPIQRDQAMILISNDPEAVSMVSDALAERAARLRPVDLWGDIVDGDKQTHHIRLMSANLISSLLRGDRGPIESFSAMVGGDASEDYYVRNVANQVKEMLADSLMDSIPTMSESSLVDLLPVLRDFLDVSTHEYYNDQAIESSCLLAHVVAGKAQDYVQWKQSNGDDEDDEDSYQGDIDDLWPPVSQYLKSTGASDDAKRIEMVFTLWKLASEAGFGVGSGHFQEGVKESCESCRTAIMGLDAIKEAGLMSAEELVANGAALAQINPVDGEIWRQVAWEHVALEQFEAAETAFQRALQVTPDELEQARENRKVEYAWILRENGKADEAIRQLENVDASMMLGDNTARLKQLKSSLE